METQYTNHEELISRYSRHIADAIITDGFRCLTPLLSNLIGELTTTKQNSVPLADRNYPISLLELSTRPFTCLNRVGITTVEQLCKHTPKQLLRLKNMGARSLSEIEDALAELNLKLKGQ